MRVTLFRKQILEEKASQGFGKILLSAPFSVKVIITLLVALFVTALLFLSLGHYNRRETGVGILVPDRGLIKIYAPRSGTIETVSVNEGDIVDEGAQLFALSQDKTFAADRKAAKDRLVELESLNKNIEERLKILPERKLKEIGSISTELESMKKNMRLLGAQKELDDERLKLKEDRHQRLAPLYQDKAVSADEYQQDRDQFLQMKMKIHSGSQEVLQAQVQENILKSKLELIEAQYADEEGRLLTQLTSVKQQISNLSLQQNQTITAPVRARVSAIQAYPGMSANEQKPLATLLPHNSHLEAHLFVATRAIGFVKKGQKVLLQYAAFPHQKYGVQIGHVKDVSHTVLNPSEISELDMSSYSEPFYRITVSLDSESISAFEEKISLQSGMLLNADIILEKRSLIEWILEPLYRVRG